MSIQELKGTESSMRAMIVGFALLLGALPSVAQNPDSRATSSMVIALEFAWNQAAEHKDTKALDALMDDSLVLISPAGAYMSKTDYLAAATKAPELDPELQVTESMTVVVYDHCAIFRAIGRSTGVNKGKPYSSRGRVVDIWINRGGRWVCVASQVTPITQ